MPKIFPYRFSITIIALTLMLMFALSGCSDGLQSSASSRDKQIPGGGGEKQGKRNTEYTFMPDSTGLWLFNMIVDGDGSSDINVLDQNGEPFTPQRIGGGDRDTFLVAWFDEGTTYTINTVLRPYPNGNPMSYTLTAAPVGTIPGGGGNARATGYYSVFTFTPDLSGTWAFRTSDANIRAEWLRAPGLVLSEISDLDLNDFVYDSGGGGESDSLITMQLDAGTTYRISIELAGKSDSCALAVSRIE